MRRRRLAIHEAGHAIAAHYAGAKVKEICLDDRSGSVLFEEPEKKEGSAFYFILAVIAGYLAQFMEMGEAFWETNPKASVRESPDMDILRAFNIPNVASKNEFKGLLHSLHGFLANPPIWGKVQNLADALRDNPKGLKDVDIIIGSTDRERIPEHDPAPLIKFICDELFS